MHAAADRPEFAPPPEPALLRAFGLAILAHVLLVLALMYGLRWQREAQDAGVEAELWSAVPQQAAPKVEPPAPAPEPPKPVVQAPPQPDPQLKRDADIALEREKARREAERRREEELEQERERAARIKAEADKRKRDQELARRKLEEQKRVAEQKRLQEEKERKEKLAAAEEKKREQIRNDTMKRMQAMAGNAPPNATGSAARSAGPSASWAGKVQARVRPNIVFGDTVSGNPEAHVEVRLGPGGLIIGTPRVVKSSGNPAWDEAVVRALQKTETLPSDEGRYPSPVTIVFRPKA